MAVAIQDLGDIVRQNVSCRLEAAVFSEVADERLDNSHLMTGCSFDVIRLLAQQPVYRCADRAVSEQRDRNVSQRPASVPERSLADAQRVAVRSTGHPVTWAHHEGV